MNDIFLTPEKLKNVLTEIIDNPAFIDRLQVCEAIENSLCDIIRESLNKSSDWSVEHFLLLSAGLMFRGILNLQEKIWCLDVSRPDYNIVLMTEEIKGIEINKIYIKRIGDSLEYKLIDSNSGKVITDSISYRDWTRLAPGITMEIPDYAFDEKALLRISPNILNSIEKKGHIYIKNFRERNVCFNKYIYIMKEMPEQKVLLSNYKGNVIFLIKSKGLNLFYIDEVDAYPVPLPYPCEFENILNMQELKNQNPLEPLSGKLCKELRKIISSAIIKQTIMDVIEYYEMNLNLLDDRKTRNPKGFLLLKNRIYKHYKKIECGKNPFSPSDVIFRFQYSYLKIHHLLEQLILLTSFGLDEEKFMNGLPRPKTLNISQAAKFLSKQFGKKINKINVLEFCCESSFGAYLLRGHPQIKRFVGTDNVVQKVDLYIKSKITEESYKYFYNGLVRLIKNPIHRIADDLITLRDGGIIRSQYHIPLQSSLSELIQGVSISLSQRSDLDSIKLEMDDLFFVEEELIEFINSEIIKYKSSEMLPEKFQKINVKNSVELSEKNSNQKQDEFPPNFFENLNGSYLIGFNAKSKDDYASFGESRGLRIIYRLISRPGLTFSQEELLSEELAKSSYSEMSEETALDEELSIENRDQCKFIYTEKDLVKLKKLYGLRLDEIKEEMEEAEETANHEKLEKLKGERAKILKELNSKFNRHGKPRPDPRAPSEKGRKSSGKAIKCAIEKIRKKLPHLAKHLDESITTPTGKQTCYTNKEISWCVK